VIHFYTFSQWYPEARHLNTFKRMSTFHNDRDKLGYLESLFPTESRQYAMKNYISLMGQDVQATSVEELEQATKAAYSNLAQIKQQFEAVDNKFDSEVQQRDAQLLKKPFDHETEIDHRPELNYYNYDHQEVEEIFNYSDKAEYLNHYLEEHQQELSRTMTNGDWLHIYASSIKDWGLNVDNLMRVSLSKGRKQPEDYLGELQSLLGVSRPSWEAIADYAEFLGLLYEAGQQATEAPNAKANYEMIAD
jgi:hypothetical protein